MAGAAEENGECRLAGIKMIALQGVQDGIITDKSKVKSYIQYLIRELAKDKPIDCLNVALSGKALRISEHKVNVPIRKKVRESDIAQAENRCTELVLSKGDELVDIIPVTYAVDRGNCNGPGRNDGQKSGCPFSGVSFGCCLFDRDS